MNDIKETRGRNALPAAQPVAVAINHQAIAEASAAADQFQALQAGYGEERDFLNQLLGQAQMADAFAKFSVTVTTSKLAFVKENKLYQSLKGKKSGDGHHFSGTWEEFCSLLNRSREQVDEDIRNLRCLGEEALESMSRMGIGYRELRQYRKLPEDQKQALIEVAKAGDKEGFVELAEEIIGKHAKEKESLTAQVEEARATIEAKDRVLEHNSTKINELDVALALAQTGKYTPPKGSEAKNAQEQAILTELEQAASSAYVTLRRLSNAAKVALTDGGAPEHLQVRGRQAIEFLTQQIAEVVEELGVEVDLNERISPNWLDEEALEVLEARNAASAK